MSGPGPDSGPIPIQNQEVKSWPFPTGASDMLVRERIKEYSRVSTYINGAI